MSLGTDSLSADENGYVNSACREKTKHLLAKRYTTSTTTTLPGLLLLLLLLLLRKSFLFSFEIQGG